MDRPTNEQLRELQRTTRNKGAGREIHTHILRALAGDVNSLAFCEGALNSRTRWSDANKEAISVAHVSELTITITIPADLASSVAAAIESHADWYRRDTGHSAEGIAVLRADADRLDDLAEEIRNASKEQ